MDCSLPGSSIHGIFQARVLEWVAIAFSEWTSRSLPCPSYCKQCCDEHWGTCVSFNSGFLGVYAQQWHCWVIRQFYFQLLKDLHTVLQSGCTSLHSHQQCKSVPFPPHPLQHLLFVDFWIAAILTSVAVSICISLIMSAVEHLFIVFVSHLYVVFGEMSI